MKINYGKLANVINVPMRIGLGFGSGLFIRETYIAIAKDSSPMMRLVIYAGALCTAFGVGHALDLALNVAMDRLNDLEDDQKALLNAHLNIM